MVMNNRIGYDVRLLVEKLFPCHVLKQIHTEYDSEDYYKEKRHWYISYPEINRVKFYDSLFCRSQTLYSDEGEEIKARGSNVNVHDMSIPRINKLVQISPVLTMIDDEYAEATPELTEWIHNHCIEVKNETLEDVLRVSSKTFEIDYITEFKDCRSPSFHNGSWAYSSQPLKMSGNEINKVLNSIQDELLCKKIECIFKSYGKKIYKE